MEKFGKILENCKYKNTKYLQSPLQIAIIITTSFLSIYINIYLIKLEFAYG